MQQERLSSGPLWSKNPRREAMLEPEEVSAMLRLNELGGPNGLPENLGLAATQ